MVRTSFGRPNPGPAFLPVPRLSGYRTPIIFPRRMPRTITKVARPLQPASICDQSLIILFFYPRTLLPTSDRKHLIFFRSFVDRTGAGKEELDTLKARERAQWEAMTLTQRIRDVAARHEYGFIGGAWAASMVGAFGYIMRDP